MAAILASKSGNSLLQKCYERFPVNSRLRKIAGLINCSALVTDCLTGNMNARRFFILNSELHFLVEEL